MYHVPVPRYMDTPYVGQAYGTDEHISDRCPLVCSTLDSQEIKELHHSFQHC